MTNNRVAVAFEKDQGSAQSYAAIPIVQEQQGTSTVEGPVGLQVQHV